MTPLRQRFIDDLRLKNFSDGTIKVYVHAVEKFSRFLGRSPDESTAQRTCGRLWFTNWTAAFHAVTASSCAMLCGICIWTRWDANG